MVTWVLLGSTHTPRPYIVDFGALLEAASPVVQGRYWYLGISVTVYEFITVPLVFALLLLLYTTVKV